MGQRGPAPKRSNQRRRQNKRDVEKASANEKTYGPALTGRHTAIAKRFYAALRRSGQAQFFEPSDWAAAELVVAAIDEFARSPNAALLSSIRAAMAGLLVTEADRRRIGLELERTPPPASGEKAEVTALDDFRRRLSR